MSHIALQGWLSKPGKYLPTQAHTNTHAKKVADSKHISVVKHNQYTLNFLSGLAAEDLDTGGQILQYLHPRQHDFVSNRHALSICTLIKLDSFKWRKSEKWQTRYVKHVHLKTGLKLTMGISWNWFHKTLYTVDKKGCYLPTPVVRAFHNMTFTNEVRSWFYLVHHSNLLCSFMKLL